LAPAAPKCVDSVQQTCKRMCVEPYCPSGTCVMHTDNCCGRKCVKSATSDGTGHMTCDKTSTAAGKTFNTCGSSCPQICGQASSQMCNMMCNQGCFCKSGLYDDTKQNKCVTKSQCTTPPPPPYGGRGGIAIGRPFKTEDCPGLTSNTVSGIHANGSDWVGISRHTSPALTSEERAAIAKEWSNNGLAEHASVASFSRFSLQLMAAAAPSELVSGAHSAAIDEVDHAKLCFGIASAIGGHPVAPGAFPVKTVEIDSKLSKILESVISEVCIEETLSAIRAAQRLNMVEHPAVKAALTKIAKDEAKHAALGWKTARWILDKNPSLRPEAEDAFAKGLTFHESELEPASDNEILAAHGVLDEATKVEWDNTNKANILKELARSLLTGEKGITIDTEELSVPVESVVLSIVEAAKL